VARRSGQHPSINVTKGHKTEEHKGHKTQKMVDLGRRAMTAPLPETMVSTDLPVHEDEALRVMVLVVAFKWELEGISGGGWVDAVVNKLNSFGMKTLRDLVVAVPVVSQMLRVAGHALLYKTIPSS
jgi:hypothetical protein